MSEDIVRLPHETEGEFAWRLIEDGYAGHYWLGTGGQLAQENVLKRMDETVARSGPQLIHYHSFGEPCGNWEHLRCDEHGRHKLKIGGYISPGSSTYPQK